MIHDLTQEMKDTHEKFWTTVAVQKYGGLTDDEIDRLRPYEAAAVASMDAVLAGDESVAALRKLVHRMNDYSDAITTWGTGGFSADVTALHAVMELRLLDRVKEALGALDPTTDFLSLKTFAQPTGPDPVGVVNA